MAKKKKRTRFEIRLGPKERDRIIADWIDQQQAKGFDASTQIKSILYEVITGQSSLTGQRLETVRQEDAPEHDPDDPVFQKLMGFED